MATAKPITWRPGTDFIRGNVDGLHLFAVAGNATVGWRLITNLPGLPMMQDQAHKTIRDAQDEAVGILAHWLTRVVEAGP